MKKREKGRPEAGGGKKQKGDRRREEGGGIKMVLGFKKRHADTVLIFVIPIVS